MAKETTTPVATTAPSSIDESQSPSKPVTLSQANATAIVNSLSSSKFFTSAENKAAIENLLKHGIAGHAPNGVVPGQTEEWPQKIGNAWNTYGQPIWNKMGDFAMQAFVFVSELFSNKFNMGEAWKKAQTYGTMRDTGRQMGDTLAFFREALPYGKEGLNYTDKTGVTPAEYEVIKKTREEQLNAISPEQKTLADQKMESLNQRLQAAHGINAETAWSNFVAYKTELMDTIASRMSRVAQINGLSDTPTDGKRQINNWVSNAPDVELSKRKQESVEVTAPPPAVRKVEQRTR